MLDLTLKEIASLSNGKLNDQKFADIKIGVISIDTRTLANGEMYMPIIGEKLDGHIFINQAFEKGAIASFSQYGKYDEKTDKPLIFVENTNEAFSLLAANYRQTLDAKIIAITGSNGKTTTKDVIASVLSSSMSVRKTIGNLNNEIGVPRSLLRLDKETDIGVIEMGTDGFGQITKLSQIAKPDIAIITNIGDSHLHQLLTKENVAGEKIHILDGLRDDGIFIYNHDDPYLRQVVESIDIKQRVISFGQNGDVDYKIEPISSTNEGNSWKLNGKSYLTSLIGSHQIYNATVAIIIAELFGIDKLKVEKALEKKDITAMRSELLNCNGFDILNDSYKSNPQSLRSALDTLSILTGYTRKIAILGDMLELGQNEEELHRQIGREIDPNKVDFLLLYGPLSKYIAEEAVKRFPDKRVFYTQSKDALIDKAKYLINKNCLVLVKASRSLRLEEIVEALELVNIN